MLLGRAGGAEATPSAASAVDSVRRIAQALDRMDEERARYIACFAYLLSRVARANLEISDEETQAMERLVMERASMPEEQAVIVVQIAKTQALLFGHTENFVVAREFKGLSGREERLALLDCLFAVSAADLSISTVEDNEIRIIASELGLDHEDFIRVRAAYKDHLAVLKDRGEDEG